MLSSRIPTTSVENVDSAMEKNAQPKVQGAESVTSGTTGNRCAGINKYGIGEPSLHLESNLKVGYHRKKQVKTR